MNRKYILTDETVKIDSATLYRIRRVSDGLFGGFVESEKNLSQEGACFIYDDTVVSGSHRYLQTCRRVYENFY